MEEEQPAATAEAAANLNDHGGDGGVPSRKEKRKALKKLKRKQIRKDAAVKEEEEEQALANDPEEQLRARLREQEEAAVAERERKEFEERERLWLEAAEARRRKALEEEEEAEKYSRKLLEHEPRQQRDEVDDGDGEWEYVEEGPAEIIWKENEIIVKKKRVKVPKRSANQRLNNVQEEDRPTSNPLPPQSAAFAAFNSGPPLSAQELLESVAQQTPNFGTEQDKAHCPFHLKTGVCRFGSRCNRTHFYPDNSCTLLIKSMYGGPGLAWEQDEGLEFKIFSGRLTAKSLMFTDEEIERSYEEFYEDVHTEFLKFGEIINFKVCRNGSFHLRGNVYVHYKFLDSAVLAHCYMNGRYFAGKQIACEFVGVTRWKVAICGEYMKSRLKTCSRGTACNFIHCFRNPGGDYEWADWDNPPPKYWVKRMAVLFGPSDKLESSKNVDMEDRDLHGDYRGRRAHTRDRSYSRTRYSNRNFQDSISEKDDSDEHRHRHTSSNKKDHSSRRKTRSKSEKKDYLNLHHCDVRYSSHHYSPRENGHLDKRTSTFENDEKSKDENHQNNESHKKYRRHGSSSQTRKRCFSEEHKNDESVSRKHEHYDRQCDSPDWDFYRGYEDTCVGNSICHSANKALSRCTCDDSARYDGRQGSADHKSEREDSLAVKVSSGVLLGEGKEYQEYNSQNCLRYVSGDLKRESENKSRRHRDRDRSISSGESFGELKNSMDRNKETLRDEVRNHQNSWSELEESDGSSQKSDNSLPGNGKKYSSNSKRKHHRMKRVQENGEQANEHSYSADSDLRKKESRKSSRRGTPARHSNSSRRKVAHSVHVS